MTDLSLPQIGREFGGRDHATVLNAIRRVEQQCNAERPETSGNSTACGPQSTASRSAAA